MLTPYLPYPPASGGQIRSLYLLKYLSENHDITLICLYKNEKEKRYAAYLKQYCKKLYVCKRAEKPWQLGNVLKSVFSLLPFLMVRNYSKEAHQIIEKLLNEENFDVIHAETFYIMPHIPQTLVPVLLVEQTIEYQVYMHFIETLPLWLRPLFYMDIFKLRLSEINYWKKAQLVATVSDADQQTIKKLVPSINPVVVPNGAGDEMFVEKLEKKDISKPILLFIGNFYWLQNTEAAEYLLEKIYPPLKKRIPNIRVIIAGQKAQSKITKGIDENVQILGDEPLPVEEIRDLYLNSTLFIAPMFGPGGTNLKILQALASGLPTISTKIAAERLEVEHQKHVLIADTPTQFANSVESILKDKTLYDNLRKNAFQFAKDKYSYQSIAHQLEVMYRSIRKPKQ
jgi:glycosyltransferase involved in cell wall biosynthesis